MKKFTFLLATLLLSISSFAAETVYKTALFGADYNSGKISSYANAWTATNNDFTVDVVNANNNNNQWAYIKMGRKNYVSVGSISTQNAIDKAITKVVVTIDAVTADKINSLKLKTKATANDEWEEAGVFAVATGEQTVLLSTPAANTYYQVEADCASGSANGLITISKVEYYINEGEDIDATAIVLDKATLTLEQYKGATLTATLTPADATTNIVWQSAERDIVSVNNGVLRAENIGTTTITATAGTVSATCEVTVVAPTILTCAQAAEIALAVSDNNVVAEGGKYVIRGYVTEVFTNAQSNLETYGNYSFWMADTKGGENTFEAYQVAPVDGKTLVAVGDYVEIVGDLTKYNTTPETVGKGAATVQKLADPTTAIDNAAVETKAVKVVENGQLVIIRDGVKYNAQGVQLN